MSYIHACVRTPNTSDNQKHSSAKVKRKKTSQIMKNAEQNHKVMTKTTWDDKTHNLGEYGANFDSPSF